MTEPAAKLQGVGKDYRFFSLDDIDLEVPGGRVVGFIGRNGAGKSTTIRILMGLVHQDRGEVQVVGHAMPAGQKAAKWDIGFVSEDMRLYDTATIEWHMGFIRSIYPKWDEALARDLVKRFDLRPEQRVKGLSHGQRVKAALLLALARRPRLLLLDEPTTGLDPVARREVLRELADVLGGDDRRSVLFSSHNTADVEEIADQIAFIDRGRIIECSDKAAFMQRWRRVKLDVPEGITLPAIEGVISVRRSGRSAIATTSAYEPSLPSAYVSAGARVDAVESMTLEEIFLTSVEHNVDGAAA
jgi:ABC-2 type transport system ATP-binding protein